MNRRLGYTLIEMSIVIGILGLLVAGGLSVVTSKTEAMRLDTTNQRLDKIEKTLKSFADEHGHLPCPADGSDAETDATFGVDSAYASPNCAQVEGMLPVRTLGLSDNDAYDGWERRFTYRIASGLGNEEDFETYDGSVSNSGNLSIHNLQSSSMTTSYYRAAYVVLSHGANGYGARLKTGAANTAPTDALELENTDADTTFIKDTKTSSFDDMTRFASKAQVKQQKVATPMVYDGLVLWLDGFDPAGTGTQPADGFSIATWVDKTGGNDAAQTTAGNRPTSVTESWDSADLKMVNFDGTNDTMTGSGLSPLVGATQFTAFILFKADATSDEVIWDASDVGLRITTDELRFHMSAGNYVGGAFDNTDTAVMVTAVYNAGSLLVYLDGEPFGTVTGTIPAVSGVVDGYAVGATLAGTNFFDGQVGEIIIYQRALSTAQRQKIEKYLYKKWYFAWRSGGGGPI